MSRKRDTNWTKDEITVLLDSISEITRQRSDDGRRINSREVFEFAAKKLGEKGHFARAEREKCRTKWKKMKEEFTHAKRARETGEGRVAPGIEPFYDRMLEFGNGSFHNISPHSTIVRRSSSVSSNINNISNSSNSNQNNLSTKTNNGVDISTTPGPSSALATTTTTYQSSTATTPTPTPTPTTITSSKQSHSGSRASARIAANINGTISNDTSDTNSTILTRQTNVSGSDYSSAGPTPVESSPISRKNSRSTQNDNTGEGGGSNPSNNNGLHLSALSLQNIMTNNHQALQLLEQHQNSQSATANSKPQSQQTISNGDASNPMYASFTSNNSPASVNGITTSSVSNPNNDLIGQMQASERDPDISYRVSTGCRQITIFGDHDVDIKFRGDCVTINKISTD